MVDSFALAANKATVCFVGTPKRPMEFSVAQWERLNRKELLVTGSWMSYSFPFPGKEWQQVADGFASGTLRVVDEMIDSIYKETDYAKRIEMLHDAEKALLDDMPVIPLLFNKNFYMISSELKGEKVTYFGFTRLEKVLYKNYTEPTEEE